MMFKRRTAQTALQKFRNLIWPRMGWRRVGLYYKHRTVRIPDSEYSIAAGLAFGCAISWTPTFGLHLLQCAIFSWIARANWLAAFLGSAFGNPWTFPALMFISYHVGKALFIGTGHEGYITPEADKTFGEFIKTVHENGASWELIRENFREFLLPTLIGGYMMALATFPLLYFPFYFMVKGARMARKMRIENKAHKKAAEITGQAK